MAVDYRSSGYSSASSAAAGQSYYSYNGTTWYDLTTWESTANFCIKALVQENTDPPEISSVVVAEAALPRDGALASNEALIITWAATAVNGIAQQTVTVDGTTFSTIRGPYSGLYYSCSIGRWAAGDHTYTISTTDGSGRASSVTGTFTVAASTITGPTVASVVVAEAAAPKNSVLESSDTLRITWDATSPNRVAQQTVTIDGRAFSTINGPYSGRYFSCTIGKWAVGSHTYTIRSVDGYGASSTVTGTFTVVAPLVAMPTIASVVVAEASSPKNYVLESSDALRVTWDATSPNGIARQTVTIDGRAFSTINGPYSGRYFSCTIGRWAVGSHTYTIRSTDRGGVSSSVTGTFTVRAAAGVVNASWASGSLNRFTSAQLAAIAVQADLQSRADWGSQAKTAMVDDASINIAEAASATPYQAIGSTTWHDGEASNSDRSLAATREDCAVSLAGSGDSLTVAANVPAALRADLLTAVIREMRETLEPSDATLDPIGAGLPLATSGVPGSLV
jgi:hypothetical protein